MKSLMKQKIFNRVKFKKYIFIFLTLIFVLNITPVLADDDFETGCVSGFFGGGDVCYKSEIAIPGFPDYEFKVKSNTLGLYIKAIYEYLLYVAGVLAVIVIMIGGFQWITAGGNQSKIGEAKERVTSAIIGLFLALGSYLLLYTINPDLVKIVDLSMPSISPINSYCTEGQMVREVGSTGEYSLIGNEAECGKDFEYEPEAGYDNFQCKGIYCSVSPKICYEKECSSPPEVCIAKGKNLFESSDFSFWSGEIKSGWNGEIPMDLPVGGVFGACYKWTLYKSSISMDFGETIRASNEYYKYGWATYRDIAILIQELESNLRRCQQMDLKNSAAEYQACKQSPLCTFPSEGALSGTVCIDAN